MKLKFQILTALIAFSSIAATAETTSQGHFETKELSQRLEEIKSVIDSNKGPIEGAQMDLELSEINGLRQELTTIKANPTSSTAQKAYAHSLLNKLSEPSTQFEAAADTGAEKTAAQDVM